MEVLNFTMDYNGGVDFPFCWATCHKARVDSFISLLQFGDSENAVEHHVGPALCYTTSDRDPIICLNTKKTMQGMKTFYF